MRTEIEGFRWTNPPQQKVIARYPTLDDAFARTNPIPESDPAYSSAPFEEVLIFRNPLDTKE